MPTSPYSVIYSFGDSLSDAGDAYLLTGTQYGALAGVPRTPVSPPYYQESYTVASGTSTVDANVFSNGPVWVQDLAASLGLATPGPGQVGVRADTLVTALTQQGVNPFEIQLILGELGTTTAGNPYVTLVPGVQNGTDFAIGGSVTGPTGFNTGVATLTDLSNQLVSFQQADPSPAANALYTVWSGANDLLNLLGSSSFATLYSSGAVLTDIAQSVANEVSMVSSLVADGAQTVLVGNVPDLGLTPEIMQQNVVTQGISALATGLASTFDTELQAALTAASFGTAKVEILDAYTLTHDAAVGEVIGTPTGDVTLANVTAPVYPGSNSSYNSGDIVSTDPAVQDTYLYFDTLHPTATGHAGVADLALTTLEAACYCAGTLIRTPGGEMPVEDLRAGDEVVTAAGAVRPIRWMGHRSMAGRFIRGNRSILPVCIAAGALGDGVPARDLWVSPNHALLLDGYLVQAGDLVNGHSITQARHVESVHYYHVELDSHDVLLAENTPAESFVDDDSRGIFHNATAYWDAHPGEIAPPAEYCAPRIRDGYALEAIRRRIQRRIVLSA